MPDLSERGPTAAERLAALAALVCVTAAVVLVVAGVARNVLAVTAAALGLLLCAGSGWYAVSRRGARRLAACAGVAAGLAVVIVALLYADIRILRAVLAAVLAVLSIVSARYALRRTPGALGSAAGHRPHAAAARRPVLIMNLKSGSGKAERFRLAAECRSREIEPVILGPGDDLLQLAEDAVARGADVIGMAGGDGSQALVATVAARHDVAYVCVPAGTRNHFALDLGLDRDDVVGALDAFGGGYERRVDLASVNGRTFVNNASLGLYANVVESPEYRDAKIKTAGSRLPDLLGPGAAPPDLPYTGPTGPATPPPRSSWSRTTPTSSRTRAAGAPASTSTAAFSASWPPRSPMRPRPAGSRRSRPPGRPGGSPGGGNGARTASRSGPARSGSASTARPSRWTARWSSSPSPPRSGCGCHGTPSASPPRPGPCGS